MSDQDSVYGVFGEGADIPAVISQLHKAGLQTSQICVLGNGGEQFKNIAGKIEDPSPKYFLAFGIGGAIAGLIAGICVSLHIPGANGFQLIVPLMGTISGGACFPYFTCQLMTFLTSNKPQHWANVFEGTVNAGSIIVMAEPESDRQRQQAITILLDNSPLELTFRRALWGAPVSQIPVAAKSAAADIEVSADDQAERKLTAVA